MSILLSDLPVAHTCFFSIELPKYSSDEVMRSKLKFVINHCVTIDADDTAEGDRVAQLV